MTARRDPDTAALGVLAGMVHRALSADGTGWTYASARNALRDTLARDPLDSLLALTASGAVLFYVAEKDVNPRCTSIWDAVTFITTCFSVGYDDVFAKTSAGKAIASAIMTVGPALAAKALDPPASSPDRDETLATQKAILARLDTLIALLQPQTPTPAPPAGQEHP